MLITQREPFHSDSGLTTSPSQIKTFLRFRSTVPQPGVYEGQPGSESQGWRPGQEVSD